MELHYYWITAALLLPTFGWLLTLQRSTEEFNAGIWQTSVENFMSLFDNIMVYKLDIFVPEVKKNIVDTFLKGGIISVICLVRSIEWLTYPMTLWTVCLEITSGNRVSRNQERDSDLLRTTLSQFFLWDRVATFCPLFRAHSQATLAHILQMEEGTKQAPNPETFNK